MNISTKFKFNLPTLQDYADVTKIAENFNKIDLHIYSIDEVNAIVGEINGRLDSFVNVAEVGQ